jgi:hypothetical protein
MIIIRGINMSSKISTNRYTMVEVEIVSEVKSIITPYNTTPSGCELVIVSSDDDLKGCIFFVYKPNLTYKGKSVLCSKNDFIAQVIGVEVEPKADVAYGYGKSYRGTYPPVEYADNMAKQLHKRS